MKPVAVIQHTEVGAPGALSGILEGLGRGVQTIRIFRGDRIPHDPSGFAGIVLLGGSMGVHDDLPWIGTEIELVRAADRLGIPVAGHCLGSQMLAFALGGTVTRHPRPEIGWLPIVAEHHKVARQWWGDELAGRPIRTFQWHQDTFTPPAGAVNLASGAFCENQVCVANDMHLLVQSHLEITPELVHATFVKNQRQLARELKRGNPAAQAPEAMLADLPQKTKAINEILWRLYARWSRACRD
jgi:GMP synthase-like glutamine amidotransferase